MHLFPKKKKNRVESTAQKEDQIMKKYETNPFKAQTIRHRSGFAPKKPSELTRIEVFLILYFAAQNLFVQS